MKAFDNLAYEAKHEKPQGVQWNKYPEVKPPKEGKYLACIEGDNGCRFWGEAWYEECAYMPWHPLADYEVTHWAEINLPNQ